MKRVELLAPAKNFEIAVTAINSGADAIYIGASDFGARHNASNSLENIEKLVKYAHKFYVRVHVTVNTILKDSEIPVAVGLIKKLYSIGVDAIIIQDMALLKAAIESKIPNIQLHMSTQCDNRTLEKVKFFDNIGVSRVILARELSIEQISEICKNTNCEIETFIHGALCVCYSGQCYMSYANGGRSANRGVCAQPCRKLYSLVDSNNKVLLSNKYLLSMKDFNASQYIEKLINCGVKSFKIEGRLKDENYVKNVVLYYNNLLNKYALRTSSGTIFTELQPNLDKTFNRSYTDYFLNNRSKCYNSVTPKFMGECIGKVKKVLKDCFLIDNSSLNPQDGICYIDKNGKCDGFLVNKVENGYIYPNKIVKLAVGDVIYRNIDSDFESILSKLSCERKIAIVIEIFSGYLTAKDEDGNIVRLNLPVGTEPNNPEKLREIYIKQLNKCGDSIFYVKNIKILADNLLFLPISVINSVRRQLLDLLLEERLKNYPKLAQKHISYANFPIEKLDYRANILNNEAKCFYENCGCVVESMALESSKSIPSGVELMRTKHCLKYVLGCCKHDLGQLYLCDEKGAKFPLKFDCKNCEMVILKP